MLGDCNVDGVVNVADFTRLVINLFKGVYSSACDANRDGVLNVKDFMAMVGIIFGWRR